MEELIKRMQAAHSLSENESKRILATITGFIKEKFPMIQGAVDNLFPLDSNSDPEDAGPSDTQSTGKDATHSSDDISD